ISWHVSQFQKIGLKPAENGSYLQPVPLIEFQANINKSYLELSHGAKKQVYKKPEIITQFYKPINVNAEIVFAAYGITAKELGYDDYAHLDLKNKIVLVLEHEPQETKADSIFNGTGNTPYATPRVKALNAQ